jgi:hypothetical protein
MGPTSAGASLIDNKPSKLLNHKPNGLKSFEGSSRGTFSKSPSRTKPIPPTNQNLKKQI